MSGTALKLVFVASLTWCLLGLGVLAPWDFVGDIKASGGLLVVASLVLVGVVFGFVRLLRGRKHQFALLLWCRRFGDPEAIAGHLNRWHGQIIAKASEDRVLPVTLQDESFDTPPLVAAALVVPVFLFLMPGALGSAIWLFELPWFETTPGKFASFAVAVLAVTAPSVVAVVVARWFGTRHVKPGTVTAVAQRAIRNNRSHAGMLMLCCESTQWQACIGELLGAVRLAIIDVNDFSSSVEWEVETATRQLGADCVLLLCADSRADIGVQLDERNGCTQLRYSLSEASEEIARFSKTWQQDKHLLIDPNAALQPLGEALASAIRRWLECKGGNSG